MSGVRAPWFSDLARSVGREGMVTVWGSDGLYLGCMGIESWNGLLADERIPPEGYIVPEGDERCAFTMDACTCMKRKGHDGLHACAHGDWRGAANSQPIPASRLSGEDTPAHGSDS